MTYEEARAYMLEKMGAWEGYPFDEETLVFKVDKKMFSLLMHREGHPCVNLKYPKDDIQSLREGFQDITPGYYMNKDHWNTVRLDGGLDDGFIKELMDRSYDIVFSSLTKKLQKQILGHTE